MLKPKLRADAGRSPALRAARKLAIAEQDYHRRVHAELGASPMVVYLAAEEVERVPPDSQALAFRDKVRRKQRRADGTVSLAGRRFEIPNTYRHLEQICLRYAP